MVFLGFLFSGILIYMSYVDFENSPIIPSINTKLIKDLDFPTVTVCPPNGSYTALNYDLMKAKNFSFSERDREMLKNVTNTIFNPFSLHLEYISLMEAATNKENIANVYDLSQSYPKSCGQNCLEILVWDSEGKIESPLVAGGYNSSYFTVDREIRITLDPGKKLSKQVERWTLWIRLEVNTGTNDDWLEQVEFREGPKYTLYKQRKTWSEAESHCQNNSGHLASLASEKQYLDLREFASEVHEDVWLGGRNSNGSWEWSDQTPWTYTNWAYAAAASASDNNTCAFFCFNWNKTQAI